MLTQSFFNGVIRCGGMGIRLVSDFSVVFSALGDTGGNVGAEVLGARKEGSASIINSSSSAIGGLEEEAAAVGWRVDEPVSFSSISPSSSWMSFCEGSAVLAFFLEIFLRFLRGAEMGALGWDEATCVTTMAARWIPGVVFSVKEKLTSQSQPSHILKR